MYTYKRAHMYVCMHTYEYMHVYTYVLKYLYTQKATSIRTNSIYVHIQHPDRAPAQVTYLCVCIHTYDICIHERVKEYIHANTSMHTYSTGAIHMCRSETIARFVSVCLSHLSSTHTLITHRFIHISVCAHAYIAHACVCII